MLGTRLILLAMQGLPESGTETEAEVIAAANHQIPPIWLLGYRVEDIALFNALAGDEDVVENPEGVQYPLLVAKKDRILSTLRKRQQRLAPFVDYKDLQLVQQWAVFIEQQSAKYLALDTYELWLSLPDPQTLLSDLNTRLEYLDISSTDPEASIAKFKDKVLWQQGGRIALAGYGW